jgi:hypothetical protein
VDEQRVIDSRMRIAVDVGAAFAGLSTAIGGRLGLWRFGLETLANRVYAVKRG